MKRARAVLFTVALATVTAAHIGSPNVVFEGNAGAYPVRVVVRPPEVVPGLAEVIVRTTAADVERIVIQPVFWRTGVAGAPRGDEMSRVAGRSGTFTGQLWLMTRGSYSVYVTVAGARGSGQVIVPVNSFATGRLGLSPGLTAVLVVLGVVLLAGLVTIVRAAVGEALVAPGATLEPAKRRRANLTATVAVPVLALILFGGAKWWNVVDADYRRSMFRPPALRASLDSNGHTLRLVVEDTSAYRAIVSPVAPDHGKMMHLFLVRLPSMNAFAHLHPTELDSLVFVTNLPELPAGDYRLFGDILLENGTSLTVTMPLTLGERAQPAAPSDSDDAWASSVTAVPARANAVAPMGGGYRLAWAGGDAALPANTPLDLRFLVVDPAGNSARLAPYLGMAAHAVVLRDDGSVFIHLHPMGTVATTAQQVYRARDRGDTTARGRLTANAFADSSMMMPMSFTGELSFPYEFPKAGRYRIWVQAKPGRETLTGAFDVEVQ